MKQSKIIFIILFLYYTSFAIGQEYVPASVSISFSPKDHVVENLCKILNNEQGEILILASKFTSSPLENCLINIKNNGRRIRLVLDNKFIANNSGKLKNLLKSGVCVYSDSMHNTAHNKVVVAGNDFVFSGSYNFSDDSEYLNAENSIFMRSNEINRIYNTEFFIHMNHSDLLKSRYTVPEQCTKS